MSSVREAKERLDLIIDKARVDLYKPIQIAEVLRRSRVVGDINVRELSTYKFTSLQWRNEITRRLVGKISTSSANYQHDVWNAMPTDVLAILDKENKSTEGAVERYVYMRYAERQGTISEVITAIKTATPHTFELRKLLELFVLHPGIRRSIDKAYELIVYSLFETIVTSLKAKVRISVPAESAALLTEFPDLTRVLLGLKDGTTEWEQDAHIYRVGVTNAADRGLDMFANFGPVIQVKHLTLNENLAVNIVDQVESDSIVIVCRDADAQAIGIITKQIGWGRRIRGIVTESELIAWYDRCMKGRFSDVLGPALLEQLVNGFLAEFPQSQAITLFLEERQYSEVIPPELWRTETDTLL